MSETRPVPAELPDYRRPPVVEIVAAVQFLPVPQFGMPEAVAVARELSDWRIVDAPPALPPIVEGEVSRALQPAINLGLGTPPLRLILDSGNGRWLAQAQQDRVAVHERKSDAHGRPSFANVEPKLHDVAAAVSRALDRTILREGAPPELVELTYDNTIPVGDAWTSFAELDRVLCGLASSAGKPPYDRPEQISVAFSYVLARDEQFVGRLLVVAGPRFDDDGDLALHLRLITICSGAAARGRPRGLPPGHRGRIYRRDNRQDARGLGTLRMTTGIATPEELAPGQTLGPTTVGWAGAAREELAARIAELSALTEDWDSYGARPIDRLALRRGQLIAERALTLPLPAPRLLPVPSGGVQLEWSAGPVELELEIEPGGEVAIFVCDDDQAGQRIDGELPADDGLFNLALARLAAHA